MNFFDKVSELRNHFVALAAIVTMLGVPFTVFATKDDLNRHKAKDYKEDTLRELNFARQEVGSLINYQVMMAGVGKKLMPLEQQMLTQAKENYRQLSARKEKIDKEEAKRALEHETK